MTDRRLKALVDYRRKHDYSQAEAAASVGVCSRTWQMWEYGNHEPPKMLWLLLKYLNNAEEL